jgi:hypothetical protein
MRTTVTIDDETRESARELSGIDDAAALVPVNRLCPCPRRGFPLCERRIRSAGG